MSSTGDSLVAKRLEGKVALITGGSSGIGASTAKLFVKHGAKVLIADVQDELGHSLCTELGTPDSICYTHCDVTCETDVENTVDLAISRYGKLDIMFNNAGIAGELEWRAIASDAADFKKVLDVNVYGGFLGAKHAARVMIPAKSGCILFTSSVASLACVGLPHAYTTSKHAVVGLTKSLSVELGEYGIRVNCIAPHGVATPMFLKTLGVLDNRKAEEIISTTAVLKGTILEAQDVAQAALFLASDEAKYLSGVNLPVDGGYSLNNQTWKNGLEDLKLEGKVALITGGASGLGESTAKLFVKHGAKVLIADVQDELGHSLCTELGTPDLICYTHCGVTCETDVEKAVDLAVSKYGKLDIMFNNAGIAGESEWRAMATDAENFQKVLDVNVYGGFLGAKHAARVMIPAKSGCILFTAGVASLVCIGAAHAYTTSKHAVVGLSKSLSVELGEYGIRVNCISPHAVATPLLLSALGVSDKRKAEEVVATNAVLKGTVLEPEDVAQAALFLASDEAKYTSGVNLPVDGAYNLNNQTWKKGLEEMK